MKKDWKINNTQTGYNGFFKIIRYQISHTLFAGGWNSGIEREVFERGSAAALLPYDPEIKRILLVEQFRVGAIHEKDPWLTELIAGIIETDELPEEVVCREAMEEAGIAIRKPEFIMKYLTSPGGSTEKTHLYYAQADLSGASGNYGLADEGEDIRVCLFSPEQLFSMLDNGEIVNAMTIIALQWFRQQYLAGTL